MVETCADSTPGRLFTPFGGGYIDPQTLGSPPWTQRHQGDALRRTLQSSSLQPSSSFLHDWINWRPSILSRHRSSRKEHKRCPTRIIGPTNNRSLAKPLLQLRISTLPLHFLITLTISSTLPNSNLCSPFLPKIPSHCLQIMDMVQSTPAFHPISLKTTDRRRSSLPQCRPTVSIPKPMARPRSLSTAGRYSPAHKLAGTFLRPSQATANQATLLSMEYLNSPTFTLTVPPLQHRPGRSLHMFIQRWPRNRHLLQTYPQIP